MRQPRLTKARTIWRPRKPEPPKTVTTCEAELTVRDIKTSFDTKTSKTLLSELMCQVEKRVVAGD
jgi:hypothetical protein